MPAAGSVAPPFTDSWTSHLLRDLQATPGRLNSALRIVLASALALILMEALQMPFISIGMYFIFLIGRDSPAVSLRSSYYSCGIVVLAILVEFSVVSFTDNDPVVRLLSVAAATFVAGMIVVATNTPALGSSFGLIYCTVIALWELRAPAGNLVRTSLYLVGTFAISLGCAVAIEYLFGDRNPVAKLQEQRRLRYTALELMFRAYADDAPLAQRFDAAASVSRIAVAGQSGLILLYNTILERNLDTGTLPIALRLRITMLAELMDVASAFGLQKAETVDPETRIRCARIADACVSLIQGVPVLAKEGLKCGPRESYNILDQVEGALDRILTMPSNLGPFKNKELVTLPGGKVPFLIRGAIRDRHAVAFGLKISLCTTLCYILYHALDWPGTATSVTTVLITGLSTTGAIKQRLAFRVVGSIIGGLILGIGSAVFLFPHMDSIASLVVLQSLIAFLCAWIAAGPKFNYIGLQIAFSFYLVAYDGLKAPNQLGLTRDRSAGILIALAVMWMVFDQLWPVRTTTVMRRRFATVLRINAELFTSVDSAQQEGDILGNADVLRDQVGRIVADLRSMNGAVPYEFGASRQQHIQTGDIILRATLTTASLFWNQLALSHSGTASDHIADPGLREMRRRVAMNMDAMAEIITQASAVQVESAHAFISPQLLDHAQYGEYVRNTATRYEELRAFTAMLKMPGQLLVQVQE